MFRSPIVALAMVAMLCATDGCAEERSLPSRRERPSPSPYPRHFPWTPPPPKPEDEKRVAAAEEKRSRKAAKRLRDEARSRRP